MKEREVYFLFTDTGTVLAKLINLVTKQKWNHVSISFSNDLEKVYSFGRKQPNNPFIGGFVIEDMTSKWMRDAACIIYSQEISETDYHKMMKKIEEIEARDEEYRYNFIGLFGILFRVKINRKAALFCSQFVATVIQESNQFTFKNPIYFITPSDIRKLPGNRLVYQGEVRGYLGNKKVQNNPMEVGAEVVSKRQSLRYYISDLCNRFVP